MAKTAPKLTIARGGSRKAKSMKAKNVSAPGKKYANDMFSNAGGNTNNTLSGRGLKSFGAAKISSQSTGPAKSRHASKLPGLGG